MRLSKGLLLGGLVALTTSVWLWVYGCDERATQPWPKPEPPKDYVVYWNRSGLDSIYYAYHVLSRQLDTFYLAGPQLYDLEASADGKRLYLRYLDFVRVVRSEDLRTVAELPYRATWSQAVSPDNKHIVLHGGIVRVLSVQDYSVVFEDTLAIANGVFSANGKRYYAPGPTTPCRSVYRLDLENNFEVDYLCVPDDFRIFRVVPSIDERFLYMFRDLGNCYMFFDVYDVEGDSIVFRDGVAPACGDLVVTPDDKSVFFTTPGDPHGWPPFAYTLARYDAASRTIDSLMYWSTCIDNFATGMTGEALVVTPDGRFIVAS